MSISIPLVPHTGSTTEHREDKSAMTPSPVAGHDTAVALDGPRHPLQVTLQLVDDVIGQQRFGRTS